MRKLLATIGLCLFSIFGFSAEKLSVAASPVPHAEILEFAQPLLQEKGIDLKIVVVNDYVMPNLMLKDKEVDANFFQHKPYLDDFNANHNLTLVSVGAIHLEPIGAYSHKIKSLDELKDKATISLPNDPANGGRALMLLQREGVITLKDPKNILSSVTDIKDNPKKIRFLELGAPMLPRSLDEVDLALINTNFALDANLNPLTDSLFIEGSDSPYANIVVTREDNQSDEKIKALIDVLHSDKIKEFIKTKYKGSIIPTF